MILPLKRAENRFVKDEFPIESLDLLDMEDRWAMPDPFLCDALSLAGVTMIDHIHDINMTASILYAVLSISAKRSSDRNKSSIAPARQAEPRWTPSPIMILVLEYPQYPQKISKGIDFGSLRGIRSVDRSGVKGASSQTCADISFPGRLGIESIASIRRKCSFAPFRESFPLYSL